jgi:hypothetical protein
MLSPGFSGRIQPFMLFFQEKKHEAEGDVTFIIDRSTGNSVRHNPPDSEGDSRPQEQPTGRGTAQDGKEGPRRGAEHSAEHRGTMSHQDWSPQVVRKKGGGGGGATGPTVTQKKCTCRFIIISCACQAAGSHHYRNSTRSRFACSLRGRQRTELGARPACAQA